MKTEVVFVQKTVRAIKTLMRYEPEAFQDLVLLSRTCSGHSPEFREKSINLLIENGFICSYNLSAESITMDPERIEILRIYLGESDNDLLAGILTAAQYDTKALWTLVKSLESFEPINNVTGRTLLFYHLTYKQNRLYYPVVHVYDLKKEIKEALEQRSIERRLKSAQASSRK